MACSQDLHSLLFLNPTYYFKQPGNKVSHNRNDQTPPSLSVVIGQPEQQSTDKLRNDGDWCVCQIANNLETL